MTRKKMLPLSILLLIVLSVLSVDMIGVSAVESPYIAVVPETIEDATLTPGKNFTVSIYTDYNGSDIWSWQFELEYNPNVLHGGINNTDTWTGDGVTKLFVTTGKPILADSEKVYVNEILMTRDVHYQILYEPGLINFMTAPGAGAEVKATYFYDGVVNGDLITTDKHPDALFKAGDFNNTLGRLWQTNAFFFYTEKPIPTTYGPGILANVTFTVVGTGDSNITLVETVHSETKLTGYNATTEEFYEIVSDWQPNIRHILHGYFRNSPSAITATVNIKPNSLNLRNKGQWIKANIKLPESSNIGDIDVSTILLNNNIPANSSRVIGNKLMVRFDRTAVIASLSVGEVTLTITGEVNGTPFEGSDTIRVR